MKLNITLVNMCVQDNKGRVPKVLDVELMDHLVNICMPGDDITLTGIMKVFILFLYLVGCYIENL